MDQKEEIKEKEKQKDEEIKFEAANNLSPDEN